MQIFGGAAEALQPARFPPWSYEVQDNPHRKRYSAMLTVFILCAGDGDRWNDYLGVPKQLITFAGEKLIERSARLVTERRQGGRVYCVTRDPRISVSQFDTLLASR